MAIGEEALRGLVNTIVASHCMPPGIRHRLLRWYGVTMGRGAVIRPGFYVDNHDLTVGDGSFINMGCRFDGYAPINIGANCDIGMEVMFFSTTHRDGGPGRRAGTPISTAINVGDGCFIGSRAVIVPGVSLAPGCVVAAGAVVEEDTLPDGVYAGVPAVRLRNLNGVPVDAVAVAGRG